MAGDVLLVGRATDGPSYTAIRPRNEASLLETFGGVYSTTLTLAGSCTGAVLDYEPLALPINKVDGVANWLFSPSVSGTELLFGRLGGTGNRSVELSYVPYLGRDDLLFAARRFYDATGIMPRVCRIGGETATLVSGEWTFRSRYPGAKYNSVQIVSNTSTLTVSGMAPDYPTRTYSGSDVADALYRIDRDFNSGLLPVYVEAAGTAFPTVTAALTGGTDGTFSNSELTTLLDVENFALTSHVVLLKEIDGDDLLSLANRFALNDTTFVVFWANSPTYESPAADWVTSMTIDLPFRHNMVGLFIGSADMEFRGGVYERHFVEAAIQGYVLNESYTLTNQPVPIESFSPVLTEAELETVTNAGFMAPMRYIRNGPSVYKGVSSANEKAFVHSTKMAEVATVCQRTCSPYLGRIIAQGYNKTISDLLYETLLNRIRYVRVIEASVQIVQTAIMVYVLIEIDNEILTINIVVRNK